MDLITYFNVSASAVIEGGGLRPACSCAYLKIISICLSFMFFLVGWLFRTALSSLKITRRFWGTCCVKRREFAIVLAPRSSGYICTGHVPAVCKGAFTPPGRSARLICFVGSDSLGGRSVDAGSEWHCFISLGQGLEG